MNELNTMENRLRSWTPRRPSPALDRRVGSLSPASAPVADRPPAPAHAILLRLVPIAACLALLPILWQQGTATLSRLPAQAQVTLAMTSNVPMLAFGLTNPVVALEGIRFAPDQVPPTTLEHNVWFNGRPSPGVGRE